MITRSVSCIRGIVEFCGVGLVPLATQNVRLRWLSDVVSPA